MTTAWHDDRVDDRAIVRAVLDGDRDAFRPVVAQEALVMAYRSIASYRGDGALGAWVARIATRQAYRRLAQRRDAVDLANVPEPAARTDAGEPLTAALRTERATELRSDVAALPEPYRETVALRFYGDLALDEIARATGRPLNSVKTHLRRGLERLRDAVRDQGSAA